MSIQKMTEALPLCLCLPVIGKWVVLPAPARGAQDSKRGRKKEERKKTPTKHKIPKQTSLPPGKKRNPKLSSHCKVCYSGMVSFSSFQ